MRPAAFDRQRWPKRHEHLVEECIAAGGVLDVREVAPRRGWQTALVSSWTPAEYPGLRVVSGQSGAFVKFFLLCPRCERRCEALYRPPSARADDWRCRWCHGLIYASQRHEGARHPLRRIATPRKRVIMRNEVLRQQRAAARQAAAQREQLVSFFDPEEEDAIKTAQRLAQAFAERAARAGSSLDVGRVRERFADVVPRSLATFRTLARGAEAEPVREAARKLLERYEAR
jgi:hypothetical protein